MKVLIISLGCDKNLVDTEYMIGSLQTCGHTFTNEEDKADAIIVNSCCFINDAKEESINTILEMAEYKKHGNCQALIVTGCLAERYRDEILEEIPEVDAVLGTNSYEEIAEALSKVQNGKRYVCCHALEGLPLHKAKRSLTTGGHYAHLKIAEGCDKHCSYCIIPKIRGAYRSVPMEELLAQARELADWGVKELILVAQEWIRIMYCYPEEIYGELIDSIKRNQKVCHYLDMPIQHINDTMLQRMGRRTTKAELTDKIAHLKQEIPDITLRTTLIAGFPGETQEMHEELMYFLNETEFDRLGAFTYSPEEGTPAAGFAGQIAEEQKEAWRDDIMELQEEIICDKNEEMKDRELWVMVEGSMDGVHAYVGRTYRDAPEIDGYIFIDTSETLMTGDFVKVRVTGAYEYDLIGEMIP